MYSSITVVNGVTWDPYKWQKTNSVTGFFSPKTGSTISTLLHDKINPKNFQVLSLGDTGFLQFFRVVSRDYGKPRESGVMGPYFPPGNGRSCRMNR